MTKEEIFEAFEYAKDCQDHQLIEKINQILKNKKKKDAEKLEEIKVFIKQYDLALNEKYIKLRREYLKKFTRQKL